MTSIAMTTLSKVKALIQAKGPLKLLNKINFPFKMGKSMGNDEN